MKKLTLFNDCSPEHFYRVTQFVRLNDEQPTEMTPPYHRDFIGQNLLECRKQAYDYIYDLMTDLEMSDTCMLNDCEDLLTLNKDVNISFVISLVEFYNEEDYTIFPLNTDNMVVRRECMSKEYEVLSPLSKVA